MLKKILYQAFAIIFPSINRAKQMRNTRTERDTLITDTEIKKENGGKRAIKKERERERKREMIKKLNQNKGKIKHQESKHNIQNTL